MARRGPPDQSTEQRLAFMRLDRRCRSALRGLKAKVEAEMPALLDEFYGLVRSTPETHRFFRDDAHVQAAKAAQLRHWTTICSAEFDQRYVESVRSIGRAHARIGLEPRWYIGGYAFLMEGMVRRILGGRRGPFASPFTGDAVDQVCAFVKAALLDMDYAISVYLDASEENKRRALDDLAERFESSVSGVVRSVGEAAVELQETAQSMAETAAQTRERSTTVAAAAEQATASVSIVAASADEMDKSVLEIARQVSHSTSIAADAVRSARSTNETFEQLSRSAERIGDVVRLISDIAGQTNLLALNATIEAARAGAAGRGFSVVAAEVKTLATQTGKATDEVGGQMQSIQSIVRDSLGAIAEIHQILEEINAIAVSINAAVEQQSAATQEIARGTSEAAIGAQDVARNISHVLEGARHTGDASEQVVAAAERLGRQAEILAQEVDQFLTTIRAA